jgi:uncharacterized phage protein (TIGR02218 family)
MAAHLAQESVTLCLCWLIERRDGQIRAFTSHVEDLAVPLPGGQTVEFRARAGASASNLQTSAGRGIDNVTAYGVIDSEELSEAELVLGIYDDAAVTLYLVNYENPTQSLVLLRGRLGEVKIGRRSFEAEVRSLMQRAAQTVGKTCSPLCRVKRLGDSECGVGLAPFTFSGQTVHSVVSRSQFRTASGGVVGKPANWFAYGELAWQTGANAGRRVEVRANDAGNPCLVTLAEVMPYDVQVGDQFEIVAGCDRRVETCRLKFGNVLNFRGEPFVPGADAVLRVKRR